MHRNLIVAVALAAALATLAACSSAGAPSGTPAGGGAPTQAAGGAGSAGGGTAGSGGGGGASTVTDPCALLTQADVSAAVGQPVGPGSNAQNSHECDYQYPATADFPTIQAGIGFQDGDLASYCGEPSNPALGLSIEQVGRVGDGACFTHVGDNQVGASLTFAKNGRVFMTFALLGSGTSMTAIEAADKALALSALAHL